MFRQLQGFTRLIGGGDGRVIKPNLRKGQRMVKQCIQRRNQFWARAVVIRQFITVDRALPRF